MTNHHDERADSSIPAAAQLLVWLLARDRHRMKWATATLEAMNYGIDATYRPYSNAEPLSDEEMKKAIDAFRDALGPDVRAHGRPDLLVVNDKLSADSEDEARMMAAERLQDALDRSGLYGILRTQRLDVTQVSG